MNRRIESLPTARVATSTFDQLARERGMFTTPVGVRKLGEVRRVRLLRVNESLADAR